MYSNSDIMHLILTLKNTFLFIQIYQGRSINVIFIDNINTTKVDTIWET